jgi:hypothetical protein
MDTTQILADLRAERGRLDLAITALEALNGSGMPIPAAPPKAAPAKSGGRISPEGMARIIAATKARWARVRAEKAAGAARRKITAAGRKAMSEASKRRWAAHRKSAGAVKRTAAGGHTMSAAARKRISEAAKKRWAERKKQA